MAIAFAQVKYLSRSKALQATAAAAYRSCSKIYDERTGLTFDYTKKQSTQEDRRFDMKSAEYSILELSPLNHPDAWEEPIFFDEIETPEIPANLVPGIFGEFISSLASATETSESLSLMGVLGVISAAIAKYFKVSPVEGWQEPLNIYTLIALPPANHKSYILNMCTKPLIDWEKEQAGLLENEIKRFRSERKTQEKIIDAMRLKAAKENDLILQKQIINEISLLESTLNEPPVLPSLFTNDATPESLALSAYEQGGHFALFSDEGGIIETLAGLLEKQIGCKKP